MKNGWQLERVRISESRDFLNCVDRVGAFFLVSEVTEHGVNWDVHHTSKEASQSPTSCSPYFI